MVKSGLEFFYFEIHLAPLELLLPSAKKICPEWLNLPCRLAAGTSPREKFRCDLCDGGQNLPPLVGIGLRYLKI